MEDFPNKLTEIVKNCISKNSTLHKQNRPWFDEECIKAIYQWWAALRKFKVAPTTSNVISSKHHGAKVCRIIKKALRNSWQNYVSKFNPSTKSKTMCNMICKISSKQQSTLQKHLSTNYSKITAKKDIVYLLAKTFSKKLIQLK